MTNTVSRTVSDETLNCIIQIESGGRVRAKAATSSATGLGQFLDATWMGVVTKHRPDLLEHRTKSEVLALRYNPSIMVELLARFTEDNQRAIGMNCTGGDLYLAHFLGVADARDFFRSPPNTPAVNLVQPGVVKANRSIMLNEDGTSKTAGQVRAWAAKRMAQSGGHDWVAQYYRPPAPVEQSPKDTEPTADDIADPQDAPETATPLPEPTVVVPKEAPPEVINKQIEESAARDAETSPSWIKRQWKKVTGGVGSLLGIGTGFVFDWRLMAVVIGSVFIVFLFMIWFMGPGNVRAWIRKQVA